jgi:glucosyl-dolichyl phosphate glucuronosyltransferase
VTTAVAPTPSAEKPAERGPLRVSVIVCAWDDRRWDDLAAAVASVAAQTLPALETIVVVDHNDDLLARVRRELLGVVTLANAAERGLAGARNTGVDHARGEALAFLDDDAVADERWLERLEAAYADPGVLGVGGLVEPSWPGDRPSWLPSEFDWVVGCSYRGLPESGTSIRNPIGANMSFRREAFAGAARFRSGIGRVGSRPVGCEETEFSIRALRRAPGTRVVLDRDAVVRHRVTPERASFRYFTSRCWSEGLSKALVARHVGSDDALASERSYVRRDLPRAVVGGVASAVARRDPAGLARAAAVIAGVALAAAGYVVGAIRGRAAAGTGAGA